MKCSLLTACLEASCSLPNATLRYLEVEVPDILGLRDWIGLGVDFRGSLHLKLSTRSLRLRYCGPRTPFI
jgi:hypothetical protein